MNAPSWFTKGWPFAAAALFFLFFAYQLSRAGGCATSHEPTEQNWPTQTRPPPRPGQR